MHSATLLIFATAAALSSAAGPEWYDACYCVNPIHEEYLHPVEKATRETCDHIKRGKAEKANFLGRKKLSYDPHYVFEGHTNGHGYNGKGAPYKVDFTKERILECFLGHNRGAVNPVLDYQEGPLRKLFIAQGACLQDPFNERRVEQAIECVTIAQSVFKPELLPKSEAVVKSQPEKGVDEKETGNVKIGNNPTDDSETA